MTLAQIVAWVFSAVGVFSLFWVAGAMIPMRKVDHP